MSPLKFEFRLAWLSKNAGDVEMNVKMFLESKAFDTAPLLMMFSMVLSVAVNQLKSGAANFLRRAACDTKPG